METPRLLGAGKSALDVLVGELSDAAGSQERTRALIPRGNSAEASTQPDRIHCARTRGNCTL